MKTKKSVTRKDPEYLPKLLEYIDLVNSLRTMYPRFSNRYQVIESTKERLINENKIGADDLLEAYKAIPFDPPAEKDKIGPNEIIETHKLNLWDELPEKLRNYIFDVEEKDERRRLLIITERVDLIGSIVNTLQRVAYCVTKTNNSKYSTHTFVYEWEHDFPQALPFLPARLAVNKEGFITSKTNEFYDFMVNSKIKADRIRCCMQCGKIFWASRKDKWFCEKACGNKARQSTWRDEHRDAYNGKRRRNYTHKKESKKGQ